MRDQVVVTTYKREELLFLCLEAIRAQDPDIPILVASDRGHRSEDLDHICQYFQALLHVAGTCGYGNSFNVVSALRLAAGEINGNEIVHSIEDDTIIHPGYLRWARGMLTIPPGIMSYAVVCGRIGSPHIPNWYESPCASWKTDHLRAALGLLIPEYFSDRREEMQRVLDEKMFPNSKYKKGGAEQDGFFLRCIEYYGWKTKFPDKPLATHLGWYGYNSPPSRERPAGDLATRVEACRAMLVNAEERKKLFGHRITDAEMAGMRGI